MSDDDERNPRNLNIPAMALPGLRDLKVQFIALILFDLYLGSVVYLHEISKGSSYIEKLRDYRTLQEVYAGVARSDIDTQTTLEDNIAIFHYNPEGNTDITSVLLISCLPDSDLSPIRRIGQKTIFRSQGNPDTLGDELSNYLREYQSGQINFQSEAFGQNINVLEDDRILNPLKYQNLKGFAMYDLETKFADFRFFPKEMYDIELKSDQILGFLDSQIENIEPGKITSFIYKSIPFLVTKVNGKKIYILFVVNVLDVLQLQKMEKWIHVYSNVSVKEWKLSSKNELNLSFEIINYGMKNKIHPTYVEKYMLLGIRSDRIYPITIKDELLAAGAPNYISMDLWEMIKGLDGKKSLTDISQSTEFEVIELIKLVEWCLARNLMSLLQD